MYHDPLYTHGTYRDLDSECCAASQSLIEGEFKLVLICDRGRYQQWRMNFTFSLRNVGPWLWHWCPWCTLRWRRSSSLGEFLDRYRTGRQAPTVHVLILVYAGSQWRAEASDPYSLVAHAQACDGQKRLGISSPINGKNREQLGSIAC
jgi:hypothetical protein